MSKDASKTPVLAFIITRGKLPETQTPGSRTRRVQHPERDMQGCPRVCRPQCTQPWGGLV